MYSKTGDELIEPGSFVWTCVKTETHVRHRFTVQFVLGYSYFTHLVKQTLLYKKRQNPFDHIRFHTLGSYQTFSCIFINDNYIPVNLRLPPAEHYARAVGGRAGHLQGDPPAGTRRPSTEGPAGEIGVGWNGNASAKWKFPITVCWKRQHPFSRHS